MTVAPGIEEKVGLASAQKTQADATTPKTQADATTPTSEAQAKWVQPVEAAVGSLEADKALPPEPAWRTATSMPWVHNETYTRNLNSVLDTLVQHVPEIKQYPDLAMSIAQNALQLHDPIATGQASVSLLQMYEMEKWGTQTGQNELPPHAPGGFLSALGQTFGDIGGLASDIVQTGEDAAKNPLVNPVAAAAELQQGGIGAVLKGAASSLTPSQGERNALKGLGAAGGEVVTAAENHIPGAKEVIGQYIGLQLGELHLAGEALHALGPGISGTLGSAAGHAAGGLGAITGNPDWQARVTTDVAHGVNSGFDFLQHQYRMLSEVQREHGDAAMVQAALPFLVTAGALAASTAFTGGAAAPEDAAVLAEATTEEAAATTEEAATAAETAATAANMGKSIADYWRNWSDLLAAAKGDSGALARIMPNAGRAVETIMKYNPASLALRGTAAGMKFATSPAYLAGTAAQYATDKTIYAHQWKVTADGAAWSQLTGRPDTIGSFVGSFLPQSEATQLLESAINFGTYFMLPDPIGSVGHVYSEAYSAEGLPGWLHKYMPGSALDTARAAYDSPFPFMRKVKNGIDFMAEHTAGQIIAWNKNLTPIAGEIDALKVLKEDGSIDKTATVDKVIEYFAAIETAKKLTTTSSLPFRGYAAMLSDMVRDVPLLRQFEKLPFNVEWEKGDVKGRTVYNAKVEAHQFTPEDPMGPYIAAMMARQSFHLSGAETDALATELTHADPGRFRQVLANVVMAHTQTSVLTHVAREIRNGMKQEDGEELINTLMGVMQSRINDWIGTYGVDKRGMFAMGKDGTNLSNVMKVDATGRGDGTTFAAGVVPEQFGPIGIQKFHDTNKMVRQIANDFHRMVKDTEVFRGTRYKIPGVGDKFAPIPLQADYVRDGINRWVNDKWFKPLALLSPAWAARVSMSEVFLNIFRHDGFARLGAFWADGAAKGDMRMLDYANKVARGRATTEEQYALADDSGRFVMQWFKKNRIQAPPPKELTVLTAFVNTLRVGFDRGMVQAVGQAHLLDAAVELNYMFDAHLAPYGIQSSHGGDYDEMGYSTDPSVQLLKAENEARPKQMGLQERKVRLGKDFQRYEYNSDKFFGMRHLRAKFYGRTEAYPRLYSEYVKEFEQSHDYEKAYQATLREARKYVGEHANPEAFRARPDVIASRDNGLVEHDPNDPLNNWAQTLARDAEGFVLGPHLTQGEAAGHKLLDNTLGMHPNLAQDGDGYRYVDLRSAKLVRDGQVPDSPTMFHRQVHGSFPAEMFNDVVGPLTEDWSSGVGRLARVTNFAHKHLLGKIVNGLSRNQTFVLDFAEEKGILQGAVDAGKMTPEQASVLAAQRAMQKTLSFIHNPSDKTMWDEHLRVIAPFFFAQMQAFRRAGRLFVENPGAFEQYTKLLLGLNRGIQSVSRNGAAFITIPFGMYGIPFQVSLNSMASVNPIPNEEDGPFQGTSTVDTFLNAITPRVGPIVEVPAIATEYGLIATGHSYLAGEESRRFLGPVASSQPLYVQALGGIVPNSLAQHVIEGTAGTFGLYGSITQSYVGTQETVIEGEMTSRLHAAWGEATKMSDQQVLVALSNLLPAAPGLQLSPQQARLMYMTAKVMQEFKDPTAMQTMVDDANNKAAGLWGVRTMASWVSPFSVSVSQPMQQLYNIYKADLAKYPNNFIAGEKAFLDKYPWALPMTQSRSTSTTGIPWDSATPTLKAIDENQHMVHNYPAAAAALLTPLQSNPYSQFAANTLITLGLLRRDSPQQFLDNMVIGVGNDFLYNGFYPAYDALQKKQAGGFNYNDYNYFLGTSSTHPSWVSVLGQYYFPIWYSGDPNNGVVGHLDDATRAARQRALSEFSAMAADPQYSGNSVQDQAIYVAAQIASLVPHLKPDEAKGAVGYSATVNDWNNGLNEIANGTFPYPKSWQVTDPAAVGKALAYTIETIFRPFAQKYTDTGQPIQ